MRFTEKQRQWIWFIMLWCGGLTLINLSPHIREIFQIAGFDNIFEIA